MTTTTGTTSTTTAAPTTSTATTAPAKTGTSSVVSSAANAILTSLGSGSGVDTTTLVGELVDAQFASQAAALSTKASTATTQISSVATLKSTITSFASALQSLVKGGTLQTQPVSSNTAAVGVSAIPGAVITNLSSTISVNQLADRQAAVSSTSFASSDTVVGTGTLTLTLGSATYNSDGTMATFTGAGGDANGDGIDDRAVTITVTDGKLSSIAAAINARNAGVTASLITDKDGKAYLSLKGATGAGQAFTLSSQTDAGSGDLSALDVGIGAANTRLTSTAQDAQLTVDGVPVTRSSNTISDLVSGVKLQLTQKTTAPVSLTSTQPTDALSGAVTDFVDTYNEVLGIIKEQTDPVNGPLRADTAAKSLLNALQNMTLAPLITGAAAGTPTTLAEIGVRTNRDGTLAVDQTLLIRALVNAPDALQSMFAYANNGTTGLSGLLNSLSSVATNTTYGLGASANRYTADQSDITEQQAELATKKDTATTNMTQQFASMNSRVAAYKSIQTFLTGQIAAWNKSTN